MIDQATSCPVEAPSWAETLCRIGYVAKGVVYGLVGVLAVESAFTAGADNRGSRGVLRVISELPAGNAMAAIVVAGLYAYAGWRFAQAFLDVEEKGRAPHGVGLRVVFAASGLSYAALAVWGTTLLMGSPGAWGSSGSSISDLFAWPFGRWVVGLSGLTLVGVGVSQFVRSWTTRFMRQYCTESMSDREQQLALWIGRVGLAARGLTFSISGGFLVHAALTYDSTGAYGLGEALDAIRAAPFGRAALTLTGAAFVLYGLHCWTRARYRKIG